MMYSRKFNAEPEKEGPRTGMIPPDYSGVAYRNEAAYSFEEEKSSNRRPRRALYKETDRRSDPPPPYLPPFTERHKNTPEDGSDPHSYARPRHRRYNAGGPVPRGDDRPSPRKRSEFSDMTDPDAAGSGEYFKGETEAAGLHDHKNLYSDAETEECAEGNYSESSSELRDSKKSESQADKKKSSHSDPMEKRGGLLPGLSRLTKHSFTIEDILLAGIILLLLNNDGDSDLLLILGFLLLTGL